MYSYSRDSNTHILLKCTKGVVAVGAATGAYFEGLRKYLLARSQSAPCIFNTAYKFCISIFINMQVHTMTIYNLIIVMLVVTIH